MFETDLTLDNQFSAEWVEVSTGRLRVYSDPRKDESCRLDIAIRDVTRFQIQPFIGGGTLQAITTDERIDVVRFSCSKQRTFSQAEKSLNALVERLCSATAPAGEAGLGETSTESYSTRSHNERAPVSRFSAVVRILKQLRSFRIELITIVLAVLASTALTMVTPYLTRPLFDRILTPGQSNSLMAQRISLLRYVVLGMLASQLVGQLLSVVVARIAVSMTHRLAHGLRMQLFEQLQHLPMRFFDKQPIGSLQTRIVQDSQEMESVLTIAAQFLIPSVLLVVGVVALLCLLNLKLTLTVLLPAPAVAIASHFVYRRVQQSWPRWWHARALMNATISDSLLGIRTVRAFVRERREIARFAPQSESVASAGKRAETTWLTIFPLLNYVAGTSLIAVWYFGGNMVLQSKISPGTLAMYAAYLGLLLGPLQTFNRLAEWFGRALAAAERIFTILDEDSMPSIEAAQSFPTPRGDIQFRSLKFGYDPKSPVLRDFNLQVAAGEMIGLVGHSGAGKTTLINLLCRFYDYDEGQIVLDGQEIRTIDQRVLRSHIGMVSQDIFLLNGTVAENIAYANPSASKEQIITAAKLANAHEFILKRPDGYDSMVGERGQLLSGGERQRIAIARVIICNPPILILDEATSAVDVETERLIQNALRQLIKGRTTIAIAHRLSTLRDADRIVVLKNGGIQEIGSHDELLKRRGVYHELLKAQRDVSAIAGVSG